MLLTVLMVLTLGAFICTIVSAMGKCPLWVAVVLLCLIELLEHAPLGK